MGIISIHWGHSYAERNTLTVHYDCNYKLCGKVAVKYKKNPVYMNLWQDFEFFKSGIATNFLNSIFNILYTNTTVSIFNKTAFNKHHILESWLSYIICDALQQKVP